MDFWAKCKCFFRCFGHFSWGFPSRTLAKILCFATQAGRKFVCKMPWKARWMARKCQFVRRWTFLFKNEQNQSRCFPSSTHVKCVGKGRYCKLPSNVVLQPIFWTIAFPTWQAPPTSKIMRHLATVHVFFANLAKTATYWLAKQFEQPRKPTCFVQVANFCWSTLEFWLNIILSTLKTNTKLLFVAICSNFVDKRAPFWYSLAQVALQNKQQTH